MKKMPQRGLVHIYTGNGKGKTTAALGLALRASGAGRRVYMMQFMKAAACFGVKALGKIRTVKAEQCGRPCFVRGRPGRSDTRCAADGLARAEKNIISGKYDVVILDEANIAAKSGLIKKRDIIKIIKTKPSAVELVLTGRYCPPGLFKYADLVTEMREIKHPYRKGIGARRGVEY